MIIAPAIFALAVVGFIGFLFNKASKAEDALAGLITRIENLEKKTASIVAEE